MIISYPTALYLSVIPKVASDKGNITYTISMSSPPQGPLREIQLPAAIERRQREPINLIKPEGKRVYTNTLSGASSIGSAKKQYEVGQILEFTTAVESILQPMLVANALEIRHDTNILDLLSLGLSQSEIDAINASADAQFASLNDSLSIARQERIDTETAISENKKSQNETQKAIDALTQLVILDNTLQSVLDALQLKLSEYVAQAEMLVAAANEQAEAAFDLEKKIMAIAQMVR